jgi:hypothetical protein
VFYCAKNGLGLGAWTGFRPVAYATTFATLSLDAVLAAME